MYLRSNRYKRKRRFSFRRLLFWIFVPLTIAIGIGIYQNADRIRPVVEEALDSVINDAGSALATAQAPAPTPTSDPTNQIRLAEASWNAGSFQESVRLYEAVIDQLPNDLLAHYRLTYGLILQGRYDEAMQAAENTVTANPFSPDAWAVRALALNRNGRYGEAIASALRAIELDPQNARARAFLAESYADIGNDTRALSEAQRALEANPDNIEAQYVSGLLEWNINFEFENASVQLSNAYDDSLLPSIGIDLALMYMSSWIDRPEEGLGILNSILERNPENVPALIEMSRFYRVNQGDPDRALTYMTRCVASAPEEIDCHYELGRVQARLEDFDGARQSFERAIELGSNNPYHFWWAGEMQLSNLGDCAGAMRYFNEGYQIALGEQATESTRFASVELINALVQNFEDSMTPCQSFNPVPVPSPTPADGENDDSAPIEGTPTT